MNNGKGVRVGIMVYSILFALCFACVVVLASDGVIAGIIAFTAIGTASFIGMLLLVITGGGE